jgi:hypothetical protein
MSTPTFHGIIGDTNPIEHGGGVVYQEEDQSPEVLYFQGWEDEDGPRVTVSRFSVEDDVLKDLTWADWDKVASFIGIETQALKEYATAPNVLARAQVYESVASYSGFINLDGEPRHMTLEQAEKEYGEFVDEAHAAK